MLLKQIEYFIAVVDCHSFTEAAELCYISQSAISQQLKALENELGVQLIVREKRSFSLTLAGEYFYRHGKQIVEELEKIKKETIRRGENGELSLTIGYLKNYGAIELQQTLAEFSKIYPEVSLSVVVGTHEELYHYLINGEVDLLISDQRRAFHDNYYNYELILADCFVEISNQNPLSEREYLSVDDLKRQTCILITSKEQQSTEKEFYQNTFEFSNQFLYASSIEEGRLMVVSQRGFMPIEAIGTLPYVAKGIKRIPLFNKDKQIQRKYCAFWSKERTNYYIEEFADLLRKMLSQSI